MYKPGRRERQRAKCCTSNLKSDMDARASHALCLSDGLSVDADSECVWPEAGEEERPSLNDFDLVSVVRVAPRALERERNMSEGV